MAMGRSKVTTDSKTTSNFPQKNQQPQQRVFTEQRKIHHDLFKLEPAKMQKNVALPNSAPDWRPVEHCHFYHTVDSNGRAQTTCSAIGGHFHEITLKKNENGVPEIVSMSGPMKYGRKKVYGRWQKVTTPVNDFDDHTHDVTYIKSDEIQIRTTNVEATKLITDEAQKAAPIPGVIG